MTRPSSVLHLNVPTSTKRPKYHVALPFLPRPTCQLGSIPIIMVSFHPPQLLPMLRNGPTNPYLYPGNLTHHNLVPASTHPPYIHQLLPVPPHYTTAYPHHVTDVRIEPVKSLVATGRCVCHSQCSLEHAALKQHNYYHHTHKHWPQYTHKHWPQYTHTQALTTVHTHRERETCLEGAIPESRKQLITVRGEPRQGLELVLEPKQDWH